VPCIIIRRNTEWIETVTEGWNVLTDTNPDKIITSVRKWIPTKITQNQVFGKGNTSKVIKKIIIDEILN
ncbi:MAG: UDP-N-acetyl glucosamine 2-epimerase, partial [Thermoproteota archaeon]|nr:UDP-N-acetyl glucosamine 2-epimerase [Thermoproteota archaeon]